MSNSGTRKRVIGFVAAFAAAAVLTACATGSAAESAGKDAADSPYFDRLPVHMQESGVINFGTSPTYPPLEFKDIKTQELMGVDIDLAEAIADELGLEAKWHEQKFDQIINSLSTGLIDVGASGMTDTPERRETLDFVDYFASGVQLFTSVEQATEFSEPEDACGANVAVNRNGIYYVRMQQFSEDTCVAEGLPPVNFVLTDATADARLQLSQGRADLAAQGVEAIKYIAEVQEPGAFQLVGKPITTELAGFGISKDQEGLRDVIKDAVQAIIDNGIYKEILEKWDLAEYGLPEPLINSGE